MSDSELDRLAETISSLLEESSWHEAIRMLENRLELVNQHWDLSWNLGWAFFKLNDLSNAATYLAQSVRLNPDKAATHWAFATVLAEMGESAKAETEFFASLSLKDSYLARIGLALLYCRQGLFEKAERIHLEGLRLVPTSRERVEAYADFLSDMGRKDEANQQYARATQLPSNRE